MTQPYQTKQYRYGQYRLLQSLDPWFLICDPTFITQFYHKVPC